MKSALKVMGIIALVIGGFGLIGATNDNEIYGVIGSLLFVTYGILMITGSGKIDNQENQE